MREFITPKVHYRVIQMANQTERRERLINDLEEGWKIIASTYAGDGWVEYVLTKVSEE